MKWLRKVRFRFLQGQSGIGLLETLIAVAIMAAIGVTLLTALDTNAEATQQLDEKVVATNLATAYIEAIKASSYDETYPEPEEIITIPPQYDVSVDISFSDDGDWGDGIDWGSYTGVEKIQKLTVTVSREESGHILTVCAFKTKRVVSES
jgi:type II secretory pathway pseudopilin PulG